MVESSVRAWASELLERDLKAFERARKCFLRRPSGKRLHRVRTAARRMRSLFEDLSGVLEITDLRDLRRAIKASGAARDSAILHKIVCCEVDREERSLAREFLKDLRSRQHTCTTKTRKRLKRVHIAIQ